MTREEEDRETLSRLAAFLEANSAVADKVSIGRAYAPAQALAGAVCVGDDCAAIPDGDGFLLFAAEGMLESFVADDPWFAGYSAVMVNLSDVAAMGGRPIAVVDVLWAPGWEKTEAIWEGMAAASRAYGAPIVGGHTTLTKSGGAFLAAAVLGRAKRLITSFDARPGDELLMAVDLRGSYRKEKPFWNASVGAPAQRLRDDLAILPALAESGARIAGKDISNGGIVGTLAMLMECSGVGAELRLDDVPRPENADLARWLVSFPSFGYLLSTAPEDAPGVMRRFRERGISCASVGRITQGMTVEAWREARGAMGANDDGAGGRISRPRPRPSSSSSSSSSERSDSGSRTELDGEVLAEAGEKRGSPLSFPPPAPLPTGSEDDQKPLTGELTLCFGGARRVFSMGR